MLQKIREAIAGKKTYFTSAIGILTGLVAWSAGEITDIQMIGVVWIALQVIFVRVGSKVDAQTVNLNLDVVNDFYDDGYAVGFEDGYSVKAKE